MRDPNSGWIQLSAAEFVLLWGAAGPIPTALGIPSIGRTPRTRAELVAQASSTLAARDLGTVAAPARDLAAVLTLLAEHEVLVELTVDGQESSLAAVAASGRGGHAVAARVGDEVRLGPVERLTGPLLAAVVELRAGPGGSVNIRASDFDAACAEGERDGIRGFEDVLVRSGSRHRDVSMVSRALTTRLGGGRLGVSRGRDRAALTWIDTPEGRYALLNEAGWVTVTPVDPARLSGMVEKAVSMG